ncbi:MAG TPA: DUF5777 family beta-barrel protein [Blastocatellia bacterium]|nr:DUF5777 family beta-barrel protein [Blastocatellia bacterium]
MNNKRFLKYFLLVVVFSFLAVKSSALPEYMRVFAADPLARPELHRQCATCHVNETGGGERNAFGNAFAAAGYKITDELRQKFPDKFLVPEAQTLPVTFVADSDSQAIIEVNGKRYLIDTKTRRVSEVRENQTAVTAAQPPTTTAQPTEENPNVYQQGDVRLISLPTAKAIPKGALVTDFTHRFPYDTNKEPPLRDISYLFGLDGFAVPSFGFTYGITNRIHVGAYRSPHVVGAPILVYAGASLLDENKGHPFTAMAHVGLEGRDNFQRNFTTSLDLTVARSVTRHAQLYFVPTISFNNRPFGPSEVNLRRENTFAVGLGGALRIRPTVALLAEANWRVNEAGKFNSNAPAFGFGIEKVTISKRHAFSLVFSNGAGTTFAQRSATRRSLLRTADESIHGLTIGFNLSRRIF